MWTRHCLNYQPLFTVISQSIMHPTGRVYSGHHARRRWDRAELILSRWMENPAQLRISSGDPPPFLLATRSLGNK